MKRYFPKTAAAWNTAMVELRRWNKSRAIICLECGRLGRRRTGLAPLVADLHTSYAPNAGHRVKVSRFG